MLKPAKIRDKKAPRFRWTKYRHTVLVPSLFKRFKEANPDSPVNDWKTFKQITLDFNEMLTDAVVENRDGAKLPAHLGILGIAAFKPKKLVPKNWLAIDETGKQIKNLNIATDGLACKIVYSIYRAKYRASSTHLWKFKGDRNFTQKVSKAFRANFSKYKLMDSTFVSKIFKDDYIRVNRQHKRDEQVGEHGHQDNGQVHLQRSGLDQEHTT